MAPDPCDMVVLTSARSEVHAGLLTSILASHGIDAFSPSAAASTLRWEVGSTDPFRVFVRRRDIARAREAIEQERSGSIDIDWDEVDVGQEPPTPEGSAGPGAAWRLIVLVVCAILFVGVLAFALSGGW